MKYPIPNRARPLEQFRLAAALLALSGTESALRAQTAPVDPAAAAVVPASAEQAVKLNPFEVQADPDKSYGALNSNSITRFKVELDQLPVSADIFTQSFMNDVGATSVESMLQSYSAGVGSVSPSPDTNAGAQYNDHVAHTVIQLRGFDTTVIQRDSLMPSGPMYNPGSTAPGMTSNFDIERVEVIEGPQALLYSGGGPGGVINVVSKQARFDQPTFAAYKFAIDQYGSKNGLLDFGAGNQYVAVRVAIMNDDQQSRRVNVGQEITGDYLQIAVKPFSNTIVRIDAEETTEHGELGADQTFTSSSATADSRSGDKISYLLATNQLGANTLNAAGAPNASGSILNGMINWGQLGALSGWLKDEETITKYVSGSIDTIWSPHLSSELAFGYTTSYYGFRSIGTTLYAPQATANPTGDWAIGGAPNETTEPAHTKALRYSMVLTNDFFNGTAHSQTIAGADYVSARAFSISYEYVQADSNFNVVYNPAVTTANGRTVLPTVYYPIGATGPLQYPLNSLQAPRLTINGVNYVRQVANQINTSLITPVNPLGLTSTNLNEHNIIDNKGAFLVNFTQWDDGKLNTLLGVRPNQNFDSLLTVPPNSYRTSRLNSVDYDVGADYALLSWLRPYFSASDAVTPPEVMTPDPAGNNPQAGRGIGEEVGVKFSNASKTISGSFSFYNANGKNEQYTVPASVTSAVNPAGLNGSVSNGTYADVDRHTTGFQLNLTANPVSNWRMRLSAAETDGKINTNVAYKQYYNDQFYENGAGQVTYADGTVVYVNPTFNAKTPTVTSTTPGAVPLTVALMNSSTSVYYANPTNPSGAINGTSTVATVLKTVDPVHGSILTGAVGLPISALQITPPFAVPGSIVGFTSGQGTEGYPAYSFSFTNVYTIPHGILRGFEVGGDLSVYWKQLVDYYLPAAGATGYLPFYAPTHGQFDLLLAYSRKFGKFGWRTQLNVFNLLNHYDVVIQPSTLTGYSVQNNLSAAFYGQPRQYLWTNTFSF